MDKIKAIETKYKGFRFRSRLEARWAVFFDAMGIKYLYEPEGFSLSDGTCYLPDFLLVEPHQFFEVKGVLKFTDEHKINQFVTEYKRPVILGFDDFSFSACSNFFGIPTEIEDYPRSKKSESIFMKCNKCGNYFFLGAEGSWECPCCGYYDGDNTAQWISTGEVNTEDTLAWKFEKNKYMRAVEKAKQARFEYGESGMNGR